MWRFLVFLLFASLLLGSTHLFLYRRLIRDTTGDLRARKLGGATLGLLGVTLVLWPVLLRGPRWPGVEALLAVSFTWMGLWFMTFFALLVPEAARGLRGLAGRVRRRKAPADPMPEDPERRRFISRAVAGGTLAVTGSLGAYGFWRAYAPPVITEVPVKLRGLPRALDGFTIAQVTDIHVGNLIERRFMDEMVGRVNGLRPDLVAITGDLVDGSVPTLGRAVAALGDLKARFGSWFVTGNHEYYSGDAEWVAFLETLGIPALRNRHVRIGDAGASFDLVGVDDWGARRDGNGYDLERAIAGRDEDRPAVLLAHQPANFSEAAKRGIGLQLSGHTHGGQLFPFTLLVGIQWEHKAGLYRGGESSIYVSRGTGFWGPPMRVGSEPEIVKVVLTSA